MCESPCLITLDDPAPRLDERRNPLGLKLIRYAGKLADLGTSPLSTSAGRALYHSEAYGFVPKTLLSSD